MQVAVLLQPSTTSGILHPIAYYSCKLKTHQKNYATVEKEALVLVLALEHVDVYVGTAPHTVTVFSDHNPITFINSVKSRNVRIQRWALHIQPLSIKVLHIKGKHNVIADALSLP